MPVVDGSTGHGASAVVFVHPAAGQPGRAVDIARYGDDVLISDVAAGKTVSATQEVVDAVAGAADKVYAHVFGPDGDFLSVVPTRRLEAPRTGLGRV